MTNDELSLLTKKQLAAALRTAMYHKSFSDITISELVKTCNINRKTFYYHFEDIFDLLRWTLEADETELIDKMYAIKDYSKCIEYLMDYMGKNQHLINCAYDSIGQIKLRQLFENDFYKIIEQIIECGEEKARKKLDKDYKEFLIRFYSYGTATTLLDWITKKNTSNREATLKHLLRILQRLEHHLDIF